jgi:hypothetical protein
MQNTFRDTLRAFDSSLSWAWWYMPIFSASQEVEVGGSLTPRIQGQAGQHSKTWSKKQRFFDCLKKRSSQRCIKYIAMVPR